MLWPARIALARLRPFDSGAILKIGVVGTLIALFLVGDYILFQRLFRAAAKIEEMTPFFAIGLIQNFLELVFLVGFSVLFFSSLTSAIGAFFSDLDLEIYHSSPVTKSRILISRWCKTYVQSAYVVIGFIAPLFVAFAHQYDVPPRYALLNLVNLIALLAAPVSVGAAMIIFLVRFFPVRRVQQIAATLAIVVLSIVVIGIRMSQPERLFREVKTDDVVQVLKQIELPQANRFPSSWIAEAVVAVPQQQPIAAIEARIAAVSFASFALFFLAVRPIYFRAFVRSREDSAPTAIGSSVMTKFLDYATTHLSPQVRAMIRKEVRVVTRDAAQWSQLLMMLALLFIYLYNIKMMPLQGDVRAGLLAYLNVGMAGFVISAICLRFAYPSISAEGKAFWIIESAPVPLRRLLYVKVFVFTIPLLVLTAILIGMANYILDARGEIWAYTMTGALVMTVTLVSLGVALGALSPDFKRENAMEVALSLGGFAYMAAAFIYVFLMMFFFARPTQRFVLRVGLGVDPDVNWVTRLTPTFAAVAISIALSIIPIEIAHRRLERRKL